MFTLASLNVMSRDFSSEFQSEGGQVIHKIRVACAGCLNIVTHEFKFFRQMILEQSEVKIFMK